MGRLWLRDRLTPGDPAGQRVRPDAFFLGTHMPSWLRKLQIPLFVSHRRLKDRKGLPLASGPWALDSGGFTEIASYGEWRTTVPEYVAAVRRYRTEIGGLQWAAQMDWMCEPVMIAKTGLSVARHQELTIDNFIELRFADDTLPFVPVLQGWQRDDYLRHVEAYEKRGVALDQQHVVGVGSVCRRQDTDEIADIFQQLAALGLRLHGFGVKSAGLAKYGKYLQSADSMAWSRRGRNIRPCPHTGVTSCGNCLTHALAWRGRAIAAAGRSSGTTR